MDVVVLGEPLVEFSADHALTEARTFHLSFSGDALNASVAAAAQGARVALVTRVGTDEFGERLIHFADGHGVDSRWMTRGEGSTGAYVIGADPSGERAFVYLRHGSAASRMGPQDVDRSPVATARVVLLSGIAAAISDSCAQAVRHAAAAASGRIVYDPNFRSRLTTAEDAASVLRDVAPHSALVKISCPGDSGPLLGLTDPYEVARACLRLGASAVAVTLGENGVLLAEGGGEPVPIPAFRAELIVDQTGAGDVLAGTACAFLSRGSSPADAIRAGMAASAISLSGRGGTGRQATPQEIENLLRS
ncbi:sugar kinase [Streptosporangium lutulentum]|uniref:2-dehydro-3-deoxygluconokinase n=1 Tax=Streptosporangium lutulentum TaxID=1461250 RepID=A0ABT9QGH7_9ACTN|nr:sugar kinase [Streptosporangium lutulentum]MDP9845789.1 2-dehydro-3-deoxygluconokinase [Streptosporangium lutulentum]